jgi:DNA-binding NtrC family response regulator
MAKCLIADKPRRKRNGMKQRFMTRGGIQKCVLVLESDTVVRESIKKVLEALGYRVVLASGQAPQDEYVPDEINLLLLDLDWPSPSSHHLLRRLRMLYPLAPAIIMTGLPDFYRAEPAAQLVAVMEKPFEASGLLKIMEELLAEPRSAQQRPTGDHGETMPLALTRVVEGRCPRHPAMASRRLWLRPPRISGATK